MWLPVGRTGTSEASKEGDALQHIIQNGKGSQRSRGQPGGLSGEGMSSLSHASVQAQLGWPFGRVMQKRLRLKRASLQAFKGFLGLELFFFLILYC